MRKIGILAYGSLIEDPGVELSPLIVAHIRNIETPFNIEFARLSANRCGAPTVVPVKTMGAPVKGTILVLKEGFEISLAKDLLWRRETRNEASDRHYSDPKYPTSNQIAMGEIYDFQAMDVILYAHCGANIAKPTAKGLADLAIKSVLSDAGLKGQDGISYLMSVKRQHIMTPLRPAYEKEILKAVGADTLEDALSQLLTDATKKLAIKV